MWKKIAYWSCILLIQAMSFQNVEAQIFTTVFDEDALQFRVKQMDEFFTRFNYEIDGMGNAPKDTTDMKEYRKSILTLCNLDKYKNEKGEIDATLTKFIDYVVENNIKIHYEDSTWQAEAKGTISFENKKYDITYFLKTEYVSHFIFKWVLVDIQTPLFEQFPIQPTGIITISPAEHGIGFMTLPETYNLNKTMVGTTFEKGYKRNHLVVFDYLMAVGKIKVNTITKVIYHFYLKNVDFDVERIEKEKGYNQGWLINKIKFKFDNQDED